MKITFRNTHRSLGYFYVGLIISFSISGIFLNHRKDWYPTRYVSEVKNVEVTMPAHPDSINESFVASLTKTLGIDDKMRRFRVEENHLDISYEKHDVEIDITTGKGKLESYKKAPVIAEMTKLHKDTSNWWIYYSDIFGIAMAVIAFTGMFLQKGAFGFKKLGWKLALAGIIFPLIFLFFLS